MGWAIQGERTAAWIEGVTLEREGGGWSGPVLEIELAGLPHAGDRRLVFRTGQAPGPIECPSKNARKAVRSMGWDPREILSSEALPCGSWAFL